MTSLPVTSEKNPEELKSWLEHNRQNGFPDLPDIHRAFAYEFLKCYSHIEAADKVGLGKGVALRTLRDPLVSAFVAYLTQKRESYTLIDSAFIEVQYLSLYGKLLGEEEINMVDRDGGQFKGKKFHASEAVSALRDMAKSTKFFKEGSGQGGVNINFDLSALGITANAKDITPDPSTDIEGEVIDG